MRRGLNKLGDAIATAVWITVMHPIRVFFAALVFVALWSNFGANYYYGKWMGFGAVFLLLLGIQVEKRFGLLASLKVMYLLGHVLWFTVNPGNRYAPVQPYDLTALKLFITESGFKLLLVLTPLLVLDLDREKLKDTGGKLACVFLIMNLLSVALQAFENHCRDVNSCGGLLMNPSLNATMAAVMLPFAFKYFSRNLAWGVTGLTLAAAIMGGTSLGLGMIAAFFVLKDWRLIALSPAVIGLGWLFFGSQELLNSSDRLPMWRFFMEQWAKNKTHWWFGTGFGSFGVFSINLQNAHKMREQYWWIWMHNDWLQAVFETGLVGAGLMLATFLDGARKLWARREIPELQALLLFGLAMLVNYPLHVGLSCALGAWLVLIALSNPKPHNCL